MVLKGLLRNTLRLRHILKVLFGAISVFSLLLIVVAGSNAHSLANASPTPRPLRSRRIEETGIASWYGPAFAGRRTASGAPFRQQAFTAAHLWLPFSTLVRVTNLANGRSVDVIVNDRGPYREGRIIDLSEAAAEALGMIRSGLAKVLVTARVGRFEKTPPRAQASALHPAGEAAAKR